MPLLTIYTPHLYTRPTWLARCKDSVAQQTDQDIQHLVIVDKVGIGWAGVAKEIPQHHAEILGDYVYILSDDDWLADNNVVADFRQFVQTNGSPDFVFCKQRIGGAVYPTNWGQPATVAKISGGCIIVKRQVWFEHKWGTGRTGDFAFISSVCDDKRLRGVWFDRLFCVAGPSGFGDGEFGSRPETMYIEDGGYTPGSGPFADVAKLATYHAELTGRVAKLEAAIGRIEVLLTSQATQPAPVVEHPCRLLTIVWGDKYLDWLARGCLRGLAGPRNMAALKRHVIQWDIYGDQDKLGRCEELCKPFGLKVVLHAQPRCDHHEVMRRHATECYHAGASCLLALPDLIYGDGSLDVLLACGRPREVCVAMPHVRVDCRRWPFPEPGFSNQQLVDMAFANLHRSWAEAELGKAQSNSYKGGVSWQQLQHSMWAVQHRILTVFLANFTAGDLAADNRWDHGWPARLVAEQRQRVIGSSDAAFAVELTEPDTNVPAVTDTDPGEPDKFELSLGHHVANRMMLAIFRGTP